MSEIALGSHCHGKGRVQMVKVRRNLNQHDIWQFETEVLLYGPTDISYYDGNNSVVLPTDTVKNMVYILAKKYEFNSIEDFGIILAKYFVQKHPDFISVTKVKIYGTNWDRIITKNSKGVPQEHNHAFIANNSEKYYTVVTASIKTNNDKKSIELSITSGFENLKILKTTQSSFEKFYRDEYTTLPDVSDRLVGTLLSAHWKYDLKKLAETVDFIELSNDIRTSLLETFAGPSDIGSPSLAVQNTLYQMGEHVLLKFNMINEIFISMPNIHNLPVDLSHFGLKNKHPHGEIFHPVEEPHGIIQATILRKQIARI